MRLRRLVTMTPRELGMRGTQALARHTDRWRSEHGLARRFRSRAAADAPAPFFAGAADPAIGVLIGADARERILDDARALCGGRFDLLGYRSLSFGEPIDWHLDPVSGRRAPRVHASRIDPLDADLVGDHKVVWELNRHQWLVGLGQAYRLSGDDAYARAFAGTVRDWMGANPPGIGINWASALEAAFRLMSWTWAWALFEGAPALTPAMRAMLAGGIAEHAGYVERNLSYYFSPNTHLTGEALGLVYAGVAFPGLPGARRWRARGTAILEAELRRQVLEDGVYFEQSTCYQRYTAEFYLHYLMLAEQGGLGVSPDVAERLQHVLDVMLTLRRPDGTLPAIGDADGGTLLPLARRAPGDARGVFSTAAAVLGRADYAWAAGGAAPETAWLLGRDGVDRVRAIEPAAPALPASRVLRAGGYAVMRSGWDAEAHQLILDVGPLGCPVSAGHGHADLLSIQASVFGHPCLVDPGVFAYAPDRAWRRFFRGSTAHSTLTIDGESHAIDAGPFRWEDHRVAARLSDWRTGERRDVAEGEHAAYRRLADPVTHRRRVVFVKPSCWIVVDEVDGAAEHLVELRFQFAPLDVTVDPALWTRAVLPDGRGLLLKPFAPVALKPAIAEGALEPIEGWVAPDYGRREPAPAVTYSTVTRLPLRIVTLLLPVVDARATPPAVSALTGATGSIESLAFADGALVALNEVE